MHNKNHGKSVTLDAQVAEEKDEGIVPTLAVRENLSVSHITSSAFFARNSFDIEKSYNKKAPEEIPEEVRIAYWAYGIGSVFSAVAFLDATINEVFRDAVDMQSGIVTLLDSKVVESMAQLWTEEKPIKNWDGFKTLINALISSLTSNKKDKYRQRVERWPVLDKYQLTLYLAKKRRFDKNSLSWESADALISFRHFLVHYKPGWIIAAAPPGKDEGPEDKETAKLEKKLKDYKICPNSLYPGAIFPYTCLGWKGANWAVEASLKFTDEFFNTMSLKPNYTNLRHLLNTKKI